jgi:hypothetical protein
MRSKKSTLLMSVQPERFYALTGFIILIFSIPPFMAIGQEKREFDITVAGISIGEMTATKTVKEDMTLYNVKSQVSFWFFGWVSLDYTMDSEYKGAQLMTVNGVYNSNRGEFITTIAWQEDHYKVDTRSYKFENTKPVNKPLYHSSAVFFFEEPYGVYESMADNFGLVSPIQKVRDYYELDVGGDKNKYYYVHGELERAVMYSPIKNYVIKRK